MHALIGENGAGKSTLMKVLSGVHQADSGEILWEGKPVQIHSTTEATAMGISIIYQELNLMPNMSIRENIFLGRETARPASSSTSRRRRSWRRPIPIWSA